MPTSDCRKIAQEILDCCLAERPWPPELLRRLFSAAASDNQDVARPASKALFQVLAERLADLFELRFCDTYAALFSEVISSIIPELKAPELLARYQRVRTPRCFDGDPDRVQRVFVLSRVTLGADIAITSVVLDAAKRRFPQAEIILVGSEKSWQLFAADPRIAHLPVSYRRGTLRDRLAVWPQLRDAMNRPGGVVIDPDSRLTQLGLLPVCPEENYFFFESRSYGGDGGDSLTTLTRRWLAETFGVPGALPYMAPAYRPEFAGQPVIAVSLGVGENPAKRIADPFEAELLQALARRDALVLVDKGGGEEEAARVERAIGLSGAGPDRIRAWQGPFAGFAATIAASRLYVGYDSAGQHAAAASGTPLVSVFGGFVSPPMFARWRPTGAGPIEVVRVNEPDPREALERTQAAVERLGQAAGLPLLLP